MLPRLRLTFAEDEDGLNSKMLAGFDSEGYDDRFVNDGT